MVVSAFISVHDLSRESRERSIKRQFSRNSLTLWASDAALIGRMAEKGDGIVTMDGC